MMDSLDALATGRRTSLFATDLAARRAELDAAIRGRRVLVIGGAGSIGAATTRLVAGFAPATLHVVDQSENYLAELVRELRGEPGGLPVRDFRALPLDFRGPLMRSFLAAAEPYDHVLNFAALKHVRSEKDPYSLLQMIDTNVVAHARFKDWLTAYGHDRNYFSVSTDKAANPTSLMGASKRLMEDVVFGWSREKSERTTSARFANVAFSNGSLLQGALARIEKRQPVPVPRETRRYFVSRAESGEICLLAAFAARDGHIVFPRLDPQRELRLLDGVISATLRSLGYEPEFFDDEEAALDAAKRVDGKKWPVLLTPLDTSGEKAYEEFIGAGEREVESGFESLGALAHEAVNPALRSVVAQLGRAIDAADAVSKADIVSLVAQGVANLNHRETGKILDDRL